MLVIRELYLVRLSMNSSKHGILKALTSDLEHYRCNRVYVPWVNKGFRRTRTQWNTVGESMLVPVVELINRRENYKYAGALVSLNILLYLRNFHNVSFEVAGAIRSPSRSATMPNVQENGAVPPAAVNLLSNPTSMSSVILSPTTLPANVVAEMFSISRAPSRRTSISVVSPPNDSGRWYNCPETPIFCCDSPVARYCTGHCRTNGQYVQQLRSNDKADVVRFLY